jgi:hypothetical protein
MSVLTTDKGQGRNDDGGCTIKQTSGVLCRVVPDERATDK